MSVSYFQQAVVKVNWVFIAVFMILVIVYPNFAVCMRKGTENDNWFLCLVKIVEILVFEDTERNFKFFLPFPSYSLLSGFFQSENGKVLDKWWNPVTCIICSRTFLFSDCKPPENKRWIWGGREGKVLTVPPSGPCSVGWQLGRDR